ncbi:uncharacterized protein YcbK (DUF882 family) [Pararhizobium capsulatum DSM 1112]|uniref:Uncharacterized protein YcbK (DUF882 family) n=1 Tax=Pararhizobium capsulatum DSM 1112 TaxID=1121113 RepID=A0ABU0BPR2_9HYPH|nr:D-Ala-D-Ala carboxypeptidase family metallohydrolase [Pararhizobium capsulatum]MDQ0320231.1 uncharacterized protein YcbK (DUF882 family) [Pararhizobium capsulatum DSM 1112]
MKGLRHLGSGVAFAASLLMVSACTSTTTPSKAGLDSLLEDVAQADIATASDGTTETQAAAGPQDQQVAAVGAAQQEAGYPTQTAMMQGNDGQPGPIVLQSTSLKATSNSIFSTQPARALVPMQQQTPGGATPASNSLFNTGQMPQEPVPDSVDDGAAKKVIVPGKAGPIPGKDGESSQSKTAGEDEVSAASPIPTTSAENEVATVQHVAQPKTGGTGREAPADVAEALSLGGLFGAKRKARAGAAQTELPHDQVAALGYTAWPSSRAISMFATVDDNDPSHDDESPAIEMASLPGLARLAPNGLWLQTEKVETGCFKPELMGILKSVEKRYGQKVLVTSGHRDVAHNVAVGGAPRSRHITCEAADIQVPGITKWELASYLRTLPGRGGVGTYCHTQSVHVDVGRPRDWNWGCQAKT